MAAEKMCRKMMANILTKMMANILTVLAYSQQYKLHGLGDFWLYPPEKAVERLGQNARLTTRAAEGMSSINWIVFSYWVFLFFCPKEK